MTGRNLSPARMRWIWNSVNSLAGHQAAGYDVFRGSERRDTTDSAKNRRGIQRCQQRCCGGSVKRTQI